MRKIARLILFLTSVLLFINATTKQTESYITKKSSSVHPDSTIAIDTLTGLKVDAGLELVIAHCTGCHSSKLITQYHTDRAGWLEKIRWMQQKQKLWDLGEAEPIILDYLAKNYPQSEKINRRKNLEIKNWYLLNKLNK